MWRAANSNKSEFGGGRGGRYKLPEPGSPKGGPGPGGVHKFWFLAGLPLCGGKAAEKIVSQGSVPAFSWPWFLKTALIQDDRVKMAGSRAFRIYTDLQLAVPIKKNITDISEEFAASVFRVLEEESFFFLRLPWRRRQQDPPKYR